MGADVDVQFASVTKNWRKIFENILRYGSKDIMPYREILIGLRIVLKILQVMVVDHWNVVVIMVRVSGCPIMIMVEGNVVELLLMILLSMNVVREIELLLLELANQ